MPLIPYPDVPAYPGVPQIPRLYAGSPTIDMNIASSQDLAVNQSPNELPWGIFTASNQPLYTPTEGGTLSVLSFGLNRAMQVSDFPIEANTSGQGAAFASFNKVFQPYCPVLVLAMSGTEGEKIAFLKTLDDACSSTNLYNVFTPDASYSGTDGACTIERYSYQRSATRGATMLIVEVSLKQVLQVSPSYTNTPISSPQSPSASAPVNNGVTQPAVPTSILYSIFHGNILGTGN